MIEHPVVAFYGRIGLVQRVLHQPWSELRQMTKRQFQRLYLTAAAYWAVEMRTRGL